MGSLRKYFSKLESIQFFFRNLFHVGPLVWNVFIHSKFKMKFCVKLENRKVFSFRFKGRNWFRKYPGNHPVCAQTGSKTRLLRNNVVLKFDFMIYIYNRAFSRSYLSSQRQLLKEFYFMLIKRFWTQVYRNLIDDFFVNFQLKNFPVIGQSDQGLIWALDPEKSNRDRKTAVGEI